MWKEGDIKPWRFPLTSSREMVMITALTAIPPSPRRCRVLRPAFSTRNSWQTQDGALNCTVHTEQSADNRGSGWQSGDSHRNNCEDRVDDSGSDRGVDGLLHSSWVKDASRVVEHLRTKTGQSIHGVGIYLPDLDSDTQCFLWSGDLSSHVIMDKKLDTIHWMDLHGGFAVRIGLYVQSEWKCSS